MKNVLRICLLAGALILGGQTAMAQKTATDNSPQSIAKVKVAKLDKQLDLTGDQERTLFRAFVMDAKKKTAAPALKSAKSPGLKSNKKVQTIDAVMKKTLTDEQYKKWLTIKQ